MTGEDHQGSIKDRGKRRVSTGVQQVGASNGSISTGFSSLMLEEPPTRLLH